MTATDHSRRDALRRNLVAVNERLGDACDRAGRNVDEVRLLAVTKTQPLDVVQAAFDVGLVDLAENQVREGAAKAQTLDDGGRPPHWHLIGHLQRNKAKAAIEFVDEFHALDSVALAVRLDRLAADRDRRLAVFLEVNTSRESSKHGVAPDDAEAFATEVAELEHLDVRGWMTIAINDPGNESAVRACFAELRELAERASAAGLAGPELSMGMSDDFELAILEGATSIRVGRALFGARP